MKLALPFRKRRNPGHGLLEHVSGTWPRRAEIATPERTATGRSGLVNDVHSKLNPTRVAGVESPRTLEDLCRVMRSAAERGLAISVAGGRHAMGGQQFATGGVLLDMSGMSRVLGLDSERGLLRVQGGIVWPELVEGYLALQGGEAAARWGIRQKQTGANHLSIGGSVSANIHGRGLTMAPFIDDIESLILVRPGGEVARCSRVQNAGLFSLVCGGYGLFGVVAEVTLRMQERTKVRRVVRIIDIDELIPALDERIAAGCRYGDFQFTIDSTRDDFLRRGVFACYEPAPADTPIPQGQRKIERDDWLRLIELAHTDKQRGFEIYSGHYLATSGQVYWSDLHQFAEYVDDYHTWLDERLGSPCPCSEMISELYVPRESLPEFMRRAAATLRRERADVIYGTVRLIQRDTQSFLRWAGDDFACIVFNLHTEHTPAGVARTARAKRALIDIAIELCGSFYLTYHRWATREQVKHCHPRMPEFLRLKREHDPAGTMQSDWYRHYEGLMA